MTVSMLTTIDNHFDPFTQFDEWLAFDLSESMKSYAPKTKQFLRRDCCSYVSAQCLTSDELSFEDQNDDVAHAVDEIVRTNPLGIYTKVTKEF